MIPIILVAIGAAGSAVTGAIGTGIARKIKSRKDIEAQSILSGDSANYPKILVCGASGAGKSSLINAALEVRVAQVGSGGSVTRGVREYLSDIQKLCICECEGYTVGNTDVYQQRVKTFLKKTHVDGVWYCINAGANRLLETDEENIRQLINLVGENMINIVITKSDTVSRHELNELAVSVDNAFPSLEVITYSNDPALAKQDNYSIKQLTEKIRGV